MPASVRELPAIHLFIQTHSVLRAQTESPRQKHTVDRRVPLIQSSLSHSFCNPLSLFSYLLILHIWFKELCLLSHFLQHAEVISCTVRTDTTMLFSASQPHRHTHTNTITIVPVSCLCCHYAAAEWDMVQFPLVKDNTHTNTHTLVHILHISTQYNSCYLSLFLFPFLSLSDANTHTYTHTRLCIHSHTNITARTLWPNSPLIDVCLSVKEAQHKEQWWACVWLRGNKERSIPRQLSDSSGTLHGLV